MARPKTTELTPRELEITKAIAEGMRQTELARQLGITIETMKRHVGNIYDKTGMSSPVELCHWAIRKGLIRVEVEAAPRGSDHYYLSL